MELISKEEYTKIICDNQKHFDEIYNICLSFDCLVEGNCFYKHQNINEKIDSLIYKQMNHFSLGKISSSILEIGFNAGHSSLLYLLSNSYSTITAFDLCYHPYVIPCFEYLKKEFPNRINLYIGNSNSTVPEYHKNNPTKTFDLIHIDGGHEKNIANKDFFNCFKIASNIIIWDDTHLTDLNNLFNTYVSLNLIEEMYLYKTYEYEHRIGRINLDINK
jgi:hypothetical protein